MSKLLPSEKEVLLWQDKSEKAVLARLEKHYNDAMKDIEMKISSMLGRNDANLPHVIRRIEYQRMLKEQIQTVLERLHSNEYETISQYLTDSYTDAFVGTMYTLHQQDVPLILPIDQSVVMKAVTLDSKLKESLYTTMGKDMTALKKTVAAEVTRGIATGQMYSEIARNIRYAAGIPLRRAKTIAREEASRVQEQATFDAATEAKASGADVVKQWSSRRDGKTRDTHRMLDGQVREVNEPFTVNGKKAMHPHGFGVAKLDIGCRCTMLTRARAALDEDELKILRERAVRHSLYMDDPKKYRGEKLPKLKTYKEFKKNYLKAAETLENTGKSGIIGSGKKVAFYGEPIMHSLGAKARNYPSVAHPFTGEPVEFVVGSRPEYPPDHLLAGKGSKKPIRKIQAIVDEHGGTPDEWKHEKAFYWVYDEDGEERQVSIHWFEDSQGNRYEEFIKLYGGMMYRDEYEDD